MSELLVVDGDWTAPKLTLSPDRFELKLPEALVQEERDRVIAFAKYVQRCIDGGPTQALRGRIHAIEGRLHVVLSSNSRTVYGSYKEG